MSASAAFVRRPDATGRLLDRRGFVLVQRSTSGDKTRVAIALTGLIAHHD